MRRKKSYVMAPSWHLSPSPDWTYAPVQIQRTPAISRPARSRLNNAPLTAHHYRSGHLSFGVQRGRMETYLRTRVTYVMGRTRAIKNNAVNLAVSDWMTSVHKSVYFSTFCGDVTWLGRLGWLGAGEIRANKRGNRCDFNDLESESCIWTWASLRSLSSARAEVSRHLHVSRSLRPMILVYRCWSSLLLAHRVVPGKVWSVSRVSCLLLLFRGFVYQLRVRARKCFSVLYL